MPIDLAHKDFEASNIIFWFNKDCFGSQKYAFRYPDRS